MSNTNRYLPNSRGDLQRRRRVAVYIFLGVVGMACAWILLEHVMVKNRIAALGGSVGVQHRLAYQGETFARRYGAAVAAAGTSLRTG